MKPWQWVAVAGGGVGVLLLSQHKASPKVSSQLIQTGNASLNNPPVKETMRTLPKIIRRGTPAAEIVEPILRER